MKRIEAVVPVHKLDAVGQKLASLQVEGATVSEVRESSAPCGPVRIYRGMQYAPNFVSKLRLELVVEDDAASPIAEAILQVVRADHTRGARVLIFNLDHAVYSSPAGPAAAKTDPCRSAASNGEKVLNDDRSRAARNPGLIRGWLSSLHAMVFNRIAGLAPGRNAAC